MTHTEKLAALTAAIQKACPELEDKKSWKCQRCGHLYPEYTNGCVFCWCVFCSIERNRKQFRNRGVKKIIPEIHLEHVLRALDRVILVGILIFNYWNLKEDLSGQSERTINFLYSVICKK